VISTDQNTQKETLFALTANRFADGRVVWLTAQGYWSLLLEEAQIFSSKGDVETAQQHAQKDVSSQHILDPYAVELNFNLIPQTTREKVRAFGPSTHPEFNPRSVQETMPNE